MDVAGTDGTQADRHPPRTGGRVPSLDGLRAISITLVLLGHLSGTRGFGTIQLGVGDHAHLGVIVFFVISGFLITRLLLSEQAAQGRVSLSNFYLRRTLRLFPASYAYIACLCLLTLTGAIRAFDGRQLQDLNMFPMVSDSLATGCLMARAGGWLELQRWYLRLFRPSYSILLLAAVLFINRHMDYTVVSVLGTSAVNIGVAILIHRSAVCSRDGVGRILNSRPLVFVGGLSYSLYLWQQPLLNRSSLAWATAFPQNLVLAIAAALCSYYLIEMPVLRLRRGLRSQPAQRVGGGTAWQPESSPQPGERHRRPLREDHLPARRRFLAMELAAPLPPY
jgi:peptidoglycan/LPS O-acetylase OafA/YrhL